MRTIFTLPDHIVSKIAAGEVIERPAYAVKELLENALDAGADYITIQIEDSGLKKISISDNGEGMSEEDLLECFKLHSTSKLSSDDDLIGITTLGFRGEALSSIAAISTVAIKSRTKDAPGGHLLTLRNGVVESVSPVGAPVGTTISIENLFSNVPARKQFLKSNATEFRHILSIVSNYALSYPSVRFYLSHNSKTVLDLPKQQDMEERVRFILGETISSHLLPMEFQSSYITLHGLISRPQLSTQSLEKHFFFVNNRSISDRLISLAFKEAYGSMLPAGTYPIGIMYLSVPHEIVDVNVHPRKEQVSFTNSEMVFESIKQSVKETLEKHNLTFHTLPWKKDENRIAPRKGNTNSEIAKQLKKDLQDKTYLYGERKKNSDILQTHNLYLFTETKNGVMFIDQHAAHERILYEKLLKAFKKEKANLTTVELKKMITIDLSFTETVLLNENMTTFTKLGFSIEHFHGNTFRITHVPTIFKDIDIKKLLQELLENLSENKDIQTLDSQTQKTLLYLACRTAIMSGQKLTKEERKKLLRELENTENNATCPHGRPTKIVIPLPDLHKSFKRSY